MLCQMKDFALSLFSDAYLLNMYSWILFMLHLFLQLIESSAMSFLFALIQKVAYWSKPVYILLCSSSSVLLALRYCFVTVAEETSESVAA